MTAGTCRSCGAPVRWVKTNTGRPMPLDPEPVPTGNVVMCLGLAHVLREDRDPQVERFNAHFVTCPHAAQHRKPRTRPKPVQPVPHTPDGPPARAKRDDPEQESLL